jgi:hypothetical protein
MPDSPAFIHTYTLPVQTAGGGKEYTLHVDTSDGGKGYTLNVYTAILMLVEMYTVYTQLVHEPVFVNVYGAQESIPTAYVAWRASTTNRVSYRPARLRIDTWSP